jgi:hypothetical protein
LEDTGIAFQGPAARSIIILKEKKQKVPIENKKEMNQNQRQIKTKITLAGIVPSSPERAQHFLSS